MRKLRNMEELYPVHSEINTPNQFTDSKKGFKKIILFPITNYDYYLSFISIILRSPFPIAHIYLRQLRLVRSSLITYHNGQNIIPISAQISDCLAGMFDLYILTISLFRIYSIFFWGGGRVWGITC